MSLPSWSPNNRRDTWWAVVRETGRGKTCENGKNRVNESIRKRCLSEKVASFLPISGIFPENLDVIDFAADSKLRAKPF
jgi:hypothetical protein